MTKKYNLTSGDIFGQWKIIEKTGKDGKWLCECIQCGNSREIRATDLKRNVARNCGSCRSKRNKLEVDSKIGFWTLLEKTKGNKAKCQCICGVIRSVKYEFLYSKRSLSCGCRANSLREETTKERYGKHHYSQTDEFLDKVKQTNLGKLNCEFPAQNSEIRDKIAATNLKKYGTLAPAQNEQVKEKMIKTCLVKFGSSSAFGNSAIKEKIRQTNLEKYGVTNPQQNPEIKQKTIETCYKKYGVSTPLKLPLVKELLRISNINKYGVEHSAQLPENRNKLKEYCEANPNCNNKKSNAEQDLLNWVKQHYPSATKLRDGLELDIFIPEINLGIEYNGLYWHSEEKLSERPNVTQPRSYHLWKNNFFAKKGIRVIHIWESEWRDRREQVQSFLQSAFKKNQKRVYIRNCSIVWSNDKEEIKKAHDFLFKHHIQYSNRLTKYAINIYHKEELVATATFSKHHRNNKDWVLSRFCTKPNLTIPGLLSKISKIASNKIKQDLISWADKTKSQGNGYLKSGWILEKELYPDYFYVKPSTATVISKQSRQKRYVNTPKEMTEAEHAKLDNLLRVWDCGKIRFRYPYEKGKVIS